MLVSILSVLPSSTVSRVVMFQVTEEACGWPVQSLNVKFAADVAGYYPGSSLTSVPAIV